MKPVTSILSTSDKKQKKRRESTEKHLKFNLNPVNTLGKKQDVSTNLDLVQEDTFRKSIQELQSSRSSGDEDQV